MRLEQAIVNQLRTNTDLAALVANRIYPVTYPQNSPLPVVVYQRIAKVPEYTHDGEGGAAESTFHISSFGSAYPQAKDTASKVKAALRPWMNNPVQIGGISIGGVFLDNEIDVFNAEEVEAMSAYHILQEYRFVHTEDD